MHRRVGAAEEEKLKSTMYLSQQADVGGDQGLLFERFRRPTGVKPDYLRAHMWFNLAASNLIGDDVGEFNNRDRIAKCPSIATERGRTVLVWRKGPSF